MNLKFRKKPVVIEAFQMTYERRASKATKRDRRLRSFRARG